MDKIKILSLVFILIRISYYALAAYGLILVVIWWGDTVSPIVFKESKISSSQVRPGDTVFFTQDIIKQRLCLGEVNRWIEGDCGFMAISEKNAVLSVGPHQLMITVKIPYDFLYGNCRFMSRHQYICNPLDYLFNRRVYYSPPINFEVVK